MSSHLGITQLFQLIFLLKILDAKANIGRAPLPDVDIYLTNPSYANECCPIAAIDQHVNCIS